MCHTALISVPMIRPSSEAMCSFSARGGKSIRTRREKQGKHSLTPPNWNSRFRDLGIDCAAYSPEPLSKREPLPSRCDGDVRIDQKSCSWSPVIVVRLVRGDLVRLRDACSRPIRRGICVVGPACATGQWKNAQRQLGKYVALLIDVGLL